MKITFFCLAILGLAAFAACHIDDDQLDAVLKQFGYVKGQATAEQRSEALKKYQKMAGITQTGTLDDETRAYLKKARCGDHDTTSTNGTAKRYSLFQQKFKKTAVSYCIYNWPTRSPSMTHADIKRAIRDGLTAWEPYIPIKFTEVSSCKNTDFFFSFGGTRHPDWDVRGKRYKGNCYYGNAFNSASGVLAHAFFPQNGNLHFDDNEEWTEGTNRGINMRIVTIHEMGHALGLYHSDVSGAIMQPFYGGYISKDRFRMHRDEIDAVYELYYQRRRRSVPAVRRDAHSPLCSAKEISAVFDYPDGFTYILADGVMYRRNQDGVDSTFAKPLSELWPDVASGFTASAYIGRAKYLYLFSGNTVYSAKYTGQSIEELKFETSQLATDKGLTGKPTAAFGRGSKKVLFLVEGNTVYKIAINGADVKVKRKIGDIKSLLEADASGNAPDVINGAYTDAEKGGREVFFFTGLSYFKAVRERKQKKYYISADYPKSFLTDYLKC